MKKLLLIIGAIVAMAVPSSAQFNVFNHLGADLSVGTTGIGIELSTTLTPYVQLRAGASFVPKITFNTNVYGNVTLERAGVSTVEDYDMQIRGNVARSQGDLLVNVYPFASFPSGVKNLFVSVGAYFGGKAVIKLDGHSDEIAAYQEQGILKDSKIDIGDYQLEFEPNGNIRGGVTVKNFRPYLGIGYGRPCPSSRLGFMVEGGVQFCGKPIVCQGTDLKPLDATISSDDNWQKWMNKFSVYPVLKFTLSGKIF